MDLDGTFLIKSRTKSLMYIYKSLQIYNFAEQCILVRISDEFILLIYNLWLDTPRANLKMIFQ